MRKKGGEPKGEKTCDMDEHRTISHVSGAAQRNRIRILGRNRPTIPRFSRKSISQREQRKSDTHVSEKQSYF